MPSSSSFDPARYSFLTSVPSRRHKSTTAVVAWLSVLARKRCSWGWRQSWLPGGCSSALGWQRQPREVSAVLAYSVPVEKLLFQVFSAVGFCRTVFFFWGGGKLKINYRNHNSKVE